MFTFSFLQMWSLSQMTITQIPVGETTGIREQEITDLQSNVLVMVLSIIYSEF